MNKVKYLLFFVLFAAAAFSCKVEPDDTFNDRSTVRMDKALAQYKEILTSAPNGWVVNYYTGYTSERNGYTFLMRFNDNGTVDVALDMDIAAYDGDGEVTPWPAYPAGSTCTSRYSLKGDMGPCLNFDDYNNIFHYFSNVESAPPSGREGDRGFILMNEDVLSNTPTDGVILLKGKKTRRYMSMTPVPEDMTWAQYIQQVKALRSQLAAVYTVRYAGSEVGEVIFSGRSMMSYFSGEEGKAAKNRYGYNLNAPDVLMLSKEMDVDGVEVRNFYTADNGVTFVSSDDEDCVLTAKEMPINQLFKMSTEFWALDTLEVSASVQSAMDQAASNLARYILDDGTQAYEWTNYLFLGYSPSPDDIYDGNMCGFIFRALDESRKGYYSLYPMQFDCDESDGTLISFTYLPNAPDLNGLYDAYKSVVDMYTNRSPWKLENLSDSPNPTSLRLTSVKSPSYSFKIDYPMD